MPDFMTRAQFEAEAAKLDKEITNSAAKLEEAQTVFGLTEPEEIEAAETVKAAALKAVEDAQNARVQLDERWRRSERGRMLAASGISDAERRKSVQRVEEANAKRGAAFKSLVKALAVSQFVRDIIAANQAIAVEARANWQVLADDPTAAKEQLGSFLEGLNDTRLEADFLQAILFEAELELFGIGRKDAWLRKRDDRTHVDGLIARRTAVIERFVEQLKAAALTEREEAEA